MTLCVNGYGPAAALQQYVRDEQISALSRARISVVPLVRLFGVDDDCAYLQHVLTEEPVLLEGVSGVVLATGHHPVADLVLGLADRGLTVTAVGDCLAPRSVEEAVLEGLVAASDL